MAGDRTANTSTELVTLLRQCDEHAWKLELELGTNSEKSKRTLRRMSRHVLLADLPGSLSTIYQMSNMPNMQECGGEGRTHHHYALHQPAQAEDNQRSD